MSRDLTLLHPVLQEKWKETSEAVQFSGTGD